jgi:hypothetical protein
MIANSGNTQASNCQIGLGTKTPAGMSVSYQITDATNQLTGSTDTPVNIAANSNQTFLVRVTSSVPFRGKVPLVFDCDEGSAFSRKAVNLPDLLVTTEAGPDIIALAATLSADGIINVDPDTLLGAMSVSVINVGIAVAAESANGTSRPAAQEAPITVFGVIEDFVLDDSIDILVCETDASENCLEDPTFIIDTIIGDSGKTFSVFVVGDGIRSVPFFPAFYRLKLKFGRVETKFGFDNFIDVGSTSVALEAPAPAQAAEQPVGVWEFLVREDTDTEGSAETRAMLYFPEGSGQIIGWIMRDDVIDGFQEKITQPIQMTGNFDLTAQTFTGVMNFVTKGNVPASSANIVLSYSNHQSMFIQFDGTGTQAAASQKNKKSQISKPAFTVINRTGTFSGIQLSPLPNAKTNREVLDDLFEGKALESFDKSLGTVLGAPNGTFERDPVTGKITGTMFGCDVLGVDGNPDGLNSGFAQIRLSFSNCPVPSTRPETSRPGKGIPSRPAMSQASFEAEIFFYVSETLREGAAIDPNDKDFIQQLRRLEFLQVAEIVSERLGFAAKMALLFNDVDAFIAAEEGTAFIMELGIPFI